MKYKIALLPGDGIGPEITAEAVKVLEAVGNVRGAEFIFDFADFGGIAYELHGTPFPEQAIRACDAADAILKGPVGGPQYDSIPDPNLRPEIGGVLALRKRYDTYANLRPVRLSPALSYLSPLKQEKIAQGLDILFVRELTGGIYFGEKGTRQKAGAQTAYDTMEYTRAQVERIARYALAQAQERGAALHNVHKANVLHTSRFWNAIVEEVHAKEFPQVKLEHILVDNAACQLVLNPAQFRIMLLENMMGDILSDLGAGVMGSLGLMPSACIGHEKSYYEPAHGSAPQIAGKGQANPYAMIGSAAMMLEHSFGMKKEAEAIFQSMDGLICQGKMTRDLCPAGKEATSTSEFGNAVVRELKRGKIYA